MKRIFSAAAFLALAAFLVSGGSARAQPVLLGCVVPGAPYTTQSTTECYPQVEGVRLYNGIGPAAPFDYIYIPPTYALKTQPSTSNNASLSMPQGKTPTSPVEGWIWNDDGTGTLPAGPYIRTGGTTYPLLAIPSIVAGSGISLSPSPCVPGGPCVITATGGGGGASGLFNQVMSATPTVSGLGFTTWVNQGSSATETNVATGILIQDPTAAGTVTGDNDWRLPCKSAPTAPYTITMLESSFSQLTTSSTVRPAWGLALRLSSSGKIEMISKNLGQLSNSAYLIAVLDYSNPTTFSATIGYNGAAPANPDWWRIVNNGTTIVYEESADAATWTTIATDTLSSGFFGGSQPDQVCFAVNPILNGSAMTVLSYSD